MTVQQLAAVTGWFHRYVDEFRPEDSRLRSMGDLKRTHSGNVAAISRELAVELGWDDDTVNTAEAAGILHDVGRFRQIVEHGTFTDHESIDHGELGRRILGESCEPLRTLDERERTAILESVRCHNNRLLPDDIPQDILPLVRLNRDADKLDIFRILRESAACDDIKRQYQKAGGLAADDVVSPEAVADIVERKPIAYQHINSLTDFRLAELSWVFDIS